MGCCIHSHRHYIMHMPSTFVRNKTQHISVVSAVRYVEANVNLFHIARYIMISVLDDFGATLIHQIWSALRL